MREVIGRVVRSPWFVIFVIAVPIALVMALRESFSDRLVVTFLHVEVAPTEPDGDAWDGKKGLPDPHVVGKQRGKRVFECPPVEDLLVFDCAPNALIDPAYKIELVIGDVDVTSDDVIAKLTVGAPAGGGTEARFNVDGLRQLSITFAPRAGASERFGTRLIAVAVGVAFTLLLWLFWLRRPLSEPDSHAVGWIGGGLAIVALVLGGMLAGEAAAIPPEAPCALGAVAATLGALHASAVKPLRWYAAVLMFLGAAAVLLPIVLSAALIVGGVAVVYVVVLAVWEWLWDV